MPTFTMDDAAYYKRARRAFEPVYPDLVQINRQLVVSRPWGKGPVGPYGLDLRMRYRAARRILAKRLNLP